MRADVIYATAAILALSIVTTFARRGGPYFARPQTVYDHVSRERHPTIDDVLLCGRAAPLIPRGATVTILKPSEKPHYDTPHLDSAVGLLPRQRVVAPTARNRANYVIVIREPFDEPGYRLVETFPEGSLYTRR